MVLRGPRNCEVESSESNYFPDEEGLFYSYEACGSEDNFQPFLNSQALPVAALVEEYAAVVRDSVVSALGRLAADDDPASLQCSYVDGCACEQSDDCGMSRLPGTE